MFMNRLLPPFFVLLLLAAFPAMADISRGCSASLEVFVLDKKPDAGMTLATIDGRGSCKNKIHANDCRARARDEIDRCRNDVWSGRHADAIPASCKTMVEGSSRSGARLQYDGIFPIAQDERLTARGAFAVCCKLRPDAAKLSISFSGRITGDEKCASSKIGKDRYQDEFGFPRYEMNCSEWRAQGICGK